MKSYLGRARNSLLIVPGANTVYTRADGVYVWDELGKHYLDGNARAGQISFGHHNSLMHETDKKMYEAGVQCFETIGDFWRTKITVNKESYEISPPAFAELLVRLTYGSGHAYVVPQATGTLATNSLVKICERLRPDRRIFVAFEGAYQGRSGAALSVTNAWGSQKSWNAPGAQVVHIPFVESEENAECAIATLTRIDPKAINAVFFEGVQSVGGMRSQSDHVKEVLAYLRDYGVRIFSDEIYSGFWRTGKRFSYEYYDFIPDGITMAKVIGQGLPISAAIVHRSIFELEGKDASEVCPIGWEGGTFNWSPVAVARGIVGLSHYEKENIGAHVRAMSEYLEAKVHPLLAESYPGGLVVQFTGQGLMRGFCFRDGKKPLPHLRDAVGRHMFKNGVIFTGAGHPLINPALVFTPPFIIEKKHIDEFCDALRRSLKAAWEEVGAQ